MTRRFARVLVPVLAVLMVAAGCTTAQPQQASTPPSPSTTTPAAPQPEARPELTRLNIGLPQAAISFLPIYAAKAQGFFKDEGITDTQVLAFKGDADVLQALAGGSVDINVASLTGVVQSIESGQKVKAVWAGYNMPIFEWYANAKYKSIAETKGGRYAVTKYGALTDFLTRYALKTAGLDPEKDVKILQLGGSAQSLAALKAGQLEASILSHPLTYEAADNGFIRVLRQIDIAPDWPTHVVFSKEDWISKNPNTIKAFLRATGKGMEWIKANPDKAAELANAELKFQPEYAKRAFKDIQDLWFPDGRLPAADKGMKLFWDIAVLTGDVKEPWPNSKWLDDTFLKSQDQWRK